MNENDLLSGNQRRKIIKNGSLPTDSVFFGRLLKNQVLKAEEEARKISNAAVRQSDETVTEAVAEAVEIRRSAYQKGHEEAVSELLENILAAKETRAQALHDIEEDVLKLSLKVAEKIIGREIEKDETVRGEIILTALRQARQQEMMTVRVNAADLPLIEKMREKIDAFGRARYLDFVADQAVKEGGCLIESASGTIDARLETQLRVFEKALLAQNSSQPE